MSTKKKMLQAAAGAGGATLDITDVFSTYLYTGNGSTQTITNDIDLAGEGGMTWIKSRSLATDNQLFDTTRGATKELISNSTATEATDTNTLTAFNSNGFSLGADATTNTFAATYASWTFRKAPKFFDVVTYTGTGTAQGIAHSLGATVGSIIVKRTDTTSNWAVYHRANTVAPETDYLSLNLTNTTTDDATFWNDTAPTSTQFTVGTNAAVNASGGTYVAYLFAHNDGDGGFGPDGDADIIKCGSFTTDGSGNATVDLGWEPQFVIIKRTSSAESWLMHDIMRGWSNGSDDARLFPDLSNAESFSGRGHPTSTGFYSTATASQTYIYIAIRRGPLAPPESGTEVFAISDASGTDTPLYKSSFPIDMGFEKNSAGANDWQIYSRLTEKQRLRTNDTSAESTVSTATFDFMNGYKDVSVNLPDYYGWMWKRAPNFFDAVAYTGDGVAGRTVSHNLGVAPEMMWIKARDLSSDDWAVYSAELGNTKHMRINGSDDAFTSTNIWNATSPSITEFTLGTLSEVNRNGNTYIAYLFASLDGVSRCGSYTGNGSSQTINCGFTSGARFILIKRTDSTGDWYVWDTERGIVAGNDPHLSLNTTAAEVTSDDSVDPDNSGFIVNQLAATNINVTSASYIFYAVA